MKMIGFDFGTTNSLISIVLHANVITGVSKILNNVVVNNFFIFTSFEIVDNLKINFEKSPDFLAEKRAKHYTVISILIISL